MKIGIYQFFIWNLNSLNIRYCLVIALYSYIVYCIFCILLLNCAILSVQHINIYWIELFNISNGIIHVAAVATQHIFHLWKTLWHCMYSNTLFGTYIAVTKWKRILYDFWDICLIWFYRENRNERALNTYWYYCWDWIGIF